MILETGREIQGMGSDVMGFLGVVGVSPSTFGFWAREQAAGRLVEAVMPGELLPLYAG